jgi:hypothetical protein
MTTSIESAKRIIFHDTILQKRTLDKAHPSHVGGEVEHPLDPVAGAFAVAQIAKIQFQKLQIVRFSFYPAREEFGVQKKETARAAGRGSHMKLIESISSFHVPHDISRLK